MRLKKDTLIYGWLGALTLAVLGLALAVAARKLAEPERPSLLVLNDDGSLAGGLVFEQTGDRSAGLHVWDGPQERLFSGRTGGDAVLKLSDGQGRGRLVLRVTEDGRATVDFLNASGKIVRRVRP